MMEIHRENVIPLHLGKKGNVIVCQRPIDPAMSRKLAIDINDAYDESNAVDDEIYALNVKGKNKWSRAMVKFRRDGVTVLHRLDEPGVFDFDTTVIRIRKVRDLNLRQQESGLFKVFIYGIGPYEHDHEFNLIFKGLIQNQESKAIYGLIDEKQDRVRVAYAGDIFYECNGKYNSFREILIRERISYPSRVHEYLNQRILEARIEFLATQNVSHSFYSAATTANPLVHNDEFNENPNAKVLDGRFCLHGVIGEGSVRIFQYIHDFVQIFISIYLKNFIFMNHKIFIYSMVQFSRGWILPRICL